VVEAIHDKSQRSLSLLAHKVVSTKVSEAALAAAVVASEVGSEEIEAVDSTTEVEAMAIGVALAEEVVSATRAGVASVVDKAIRMVLPPLMLLAVQVDEVGMAAEEVVAATTIDETAMVAAIGARLAATMKHSADAIEATTTGTGIEIDTAVVAVVVAAADGKTTTIRGNATTTMAATTTLDNDGGIDPPFSSSHRLNPIKRVGTALTLYNNNIPQPFCLVVTRSLW
jgi:hypothetical protein